MTLWESGWKLPLKSIKENIYDMGIHKDVIVSKPWGYEYLVFETKEVALWLLYIKEGGKTSLHCHPNKTTGLILLDGKAEVSFLNDTNKLGRVWDLSLIMPKYLRKSCYISDLAEDYKLGKIAPWDIAFKFSSETQYNPHSFGGHNFWLSNKEWKQLLFKKVLNIVD